MSIATTHENYAHTWWTPPEWYQWVLNTLDDGDGVFDPCPTTWEPGHESGLLSGWGQRFYCNHPGSRGSTALWWQKFCLELGSVGPSTAGIWCAFNCEQIRHMVPSCFHLDGYLVMPKDRIGFVWGGPDLKLKGGKIRKHGERAKSPGNWTVFWSSVEPAETPEESVIVRTGL